MNSFKRYIINEVSGSKPVETEAMLTLQKVIDMADDGHIDYDSNKIKINVGRLIKNKKYNDLNIFIIKGNSEPKIGRHSVNNSHAIFLFSERLPQRDKIDSFLSDQERSGHFKNLFIKYFNDAVFDDTDKNTDSVYEKRNNLNNRTSFEKSYIELVNNLNDMYKKYDHAKKEVDDRIEKASNDLGHKEVLKMSLSKLKKEMIGSSVSEFKAKAIDLYGKENYKLLDKEYKNKLESRLADYYEQKFQ